MPEGEPSGSDPDGIVEVWRSDLVYHGTSTRPIGKEQGAAASLGT